MRYHHLSAELGDPDSQFSLALQYLAMGTNEEPIESLENPEYEAYIESLKKRMGGYADAPELEAHVIYSSRWFQAFDATCKTVHQGSEDYGFVQRYYTVT